MVSLTEAARSAHADRAVSFLGDHHGHRNVDRNRPRQARLLSACAGPSRSRGMVQEGDARSVVGVAGWLSGQHDRHGGLRGCVRALAHQVRLIAPQFVRPFVKGNKTDFADAEAICEVASRPSMHFVAIGASIESRNRTRSVSIIVRCTSASAGKSCAQAAAYHAVLRYSVMQSYFQNLVRSQPCQPNGRGVWQAHKQ
jgi:hypothetical protein